MLTGCRDCKLKMNPCPCQYPTSPGNISEKKLTRNSRILLKTTWNKPMHGYGFTPEGMMVLSPSSGGECPWTPRPCMSIYLYLAHVERLLAQTGGLETVCFSWYHSLQMMQNQHAGYRQIPRHTTELLLICTPNFHGNWDCRFSTRIQLSLEQQWRLGVCFPF